jgi:hypothetical protein
MAAPGRRITTCQISCCSRRVIKRSEEREVAALRTLDATSAHHVVTSLLTAIVLFSGITRYVMNGRNVELFV